MASKDIPPDKFFESMERFIAEGESVELRVTGESMRPYFRGDGSEVIVVSPFSPEELTRGLIVGFRHQGKYKYHRIISRTGDQLVIQGDGVVRNQEHVTVPDVVGIVRTVIRRNGKAISTQSRTARLYWRCWLRLTPIRKYLLFPFRCWFAMERRISSILQTPNRNN